MPPTYGSKSIVEVWDDVISGLKWEIGNSCRARFCTDNWAGELGPLHPLSYAPIPECDLSNKPIKDFVTAEDKWN